MTDSVKTPLTLEELDRLTRDLRAFEGKALGSIRISVDEVRTVLSALSMARQSVEGGEPVAWLDPPYFARWTAPGGGATGLQHASQWVELYRYGHGGRVPLYASPPNREGQDLVEAARSMETAPTDGTMVRLLIDYSPQANHADIDKTEGAGYVWPWTPLEDAEQAWTIGFNNFQNTGTAEWQFVGWDWAQDVFVQGRGKPIGWLPWENPEAALSTTGRGDR